MIARKLAGAARAVLRVWLAVDAWRWLAAYNRATWQWLRSGCDPALAPEFAFDEEPEP